MILAEKVSGIACEIAFTWAESAMKFNVLSKAVFEGTDYETSRALKLI